ncbi:helix-turn-helix domain-containing protein [Gordonia humi]
MSVPDTAERADRWRTAMAQSYVDVDVRPADQPVLTQSNFLARRELDDVSLIDLSTTSCTVRRRHRQGDSGDDCVALVLVGRGEESFTSGDHTIRLSGGQAALWEPRSGSAFTVHGPMRKRNLLIPRELLATIGVRTFEMEARALPRTPSLWLLGGLLTQLWDELPAMAPQEVSAARNAVLELLTSVLRTSAGSGPTPSRELRAQIDQWVRRNLEADLAPAVAAKFHAVSVRTLSRLYRADGDSFARHVRRLRLDRARSQLLASDDPISTIAHRWRFADASHFTRRFTEEYGQSPSEVRAVARDGVALDAGVAGRVGRGGLPARRSSPAESNTIDI